VSRRGKPLSCEQVELVTHTAPYAWAYITSTEADRKVGGGEGWGVEGGDSLGNITSKTIMVNSSWEIMWETIVGNFL